MNIYTSICKPPHFVSANEDLPIPSGSNKPIITTKVVSLKRPINVLTMPGIEIFNTWGIMIK